MSDDSIPPPDDLHKLGIEIEVLYGLGLYKSSRVLRALATTSNNQSTDKPSKAPRRRPPRKSGLYAMLHAAQQHGITHPKDGFWTMLPKEFDAILALEHKAVIQGFQALSAESFR